LTKYLEIHTTQLQQKFEEADGIGRLVFTWPSTVTVPHAQYSAFAVGTIILRLRLSLGSTWCPLTTSFQHRAPLPQYMAEYRKFFGSRLKFQQPFNEFRLDAASLNRPMPAVMKGLFDTVQELGEQKLRAVATPSDVASELHDLLVRRLAAEEPFGLESVAEAMNLNVRALQWRLEQEATTYEKILLLTRIIAAESYLRDSDHNLTKIARLLGFSELSALTRWCQHQFHMTPSLYRKKLRAFKE
jgi:AraC-like DNA-binding protein